MTKRLFLLHFLSLLVAFFSAEIARAQNNYPSLLWEISGNGLEKSSYLYGTMHVSNKLAFNLGEPFFDALEEVDQVALEMNPEAWFDDLLGGEVMASAYRSVGPQVNPFLIERSEWNEFQGRFAFADRRNQQIEEILKSSPEMINQMLFRFYDPSGNFEEDTWLDMFIYQTARKLNKNTLGLETFTESMEMMNKARKEMALNPDAGENIDFSVRMKALTEIEDAYRRGDLDLLDSLSTLVNPPAFTKFILIERNEKFVNGMDSIMHKGSLFAGMGAAHLPGEEGCIEMLRELGYKVEPITRGTRNTKKKDGLSNMVMKRPLNRYTSSDGQVSFLSPSPTYDLSPSTKSLGYITMDITNGLTFILDRVLTDNGFRQFSMEAQMASVDSILYESIPGDILKKKKVTVSGYPGFDILHKVGRGSVNRSMIIFSPYEVFIARLSASGEKIKKGAGDYFFSSLKIELDQTEDWRTIKAPYDAFSVEMKGVLTSYSLDKETTIVNDLFIQSVDQDGTLFLVHRLDTQQDDFIEDERYILKKVAAGLIEDFGLKETSRSFCKFNERTTLNLSARDSQERDLEARIITSGDDAYALICYTSDSEKSSRFLNSLKISSPIYMEEFSYIDSAAFVKSQLPWEKEYSKLDVLMNYDPYSEQGMDGESEYGYTIDLRPKGGTDEISIWYYRYPSYDYISDKEEYVELLDNELSNSGDILIEYGDYQWNDRGFISNHVLSDSLSGFNVHVHRVLEGNRLLTVSTTCDRLLGPSDLYTRFISHIELLEDTNVVSDIFQLDETLLAEDLTGTDTVRFRLADHALMNRLELPETFEYELFKKLSSSPSSLASDDEKEAYIARFNKMRHRAQNDSMMKELKAEYVQHEDSASYQKEILATLLRFKTKKATLEAKRLLLSEPPIGVWTGFYDELFQSMKDSLELSALLFPQALELMDYNEYEQPILQLLEMLVDSGAIRHETYRSKLSYFTNQAKQEMKRSSSTGYSFRMDGRYMSESDVSDVLLYWNLLFPFKNESNVASIFELAEKSSSMDLRKTYAYFLHQKGHRPKESTLLTMCDGKDILKDRAFLHLIDKEELIADTVDIVKEFIEDRLRSQWREYEYDWDSSVIDSVAFISMNQDSIRTHAFDTYTYKVKKTKDDVSTWHGHIVLVDKSTSFPDIKYLQDSREMTVTKTEEEQLEELKQIVIAENRTYPFDYYPDYGYEDY